MTAPVEDTRGKWSDADELRYDRPSLFCFKDKGTAVEGGESGWGEGEREIEVEYPVEDGAGELLLELMPDGEATPVSDDLFRLWSGMVVLVDGGALCGGFDEGWYLDGIRGEVFLDCCGEGLDKGVIAGVGGNCEWEAK